ncbi:unnamed protein product, partial [Ixodes persulcatus]
VHENGPCSGGTGDCTGCDCVGLLQRRLPEGGGSTHTTRLLLLSCDLYKFWVFFARRTFSAISLPNRTCFYRTIDALRIFTFSRDSIF